MTIDIDNVQTMPVMSDMKNDLMLLENDLDALGWDQPARLYAVLGQDGDYHLELITEMGGHPVDFLRAAVKTVGALPGKVEGIALAIEGWRHPMARDIEKHQPENWAQLMALAVASGFDLDTDMEKIYEHTNNALQRLYQHVPPSKNPGRMEIRSVMVYMRDGRGGGVNRTRDEEPEFGELAEQGRMIDAMKACLTGDWPTDPDMN